MVDWKIWAVGFVYASLSAINAIAWGYTIRSVGEPQLSPSFLFKLLFNIYFIIAMGVAFVAAVLSYVVLREMGVLAGRFFLSLSLVATVLACVVVLGERPSLNEWVGVVLIILGVIILGRA